MEELLRLDKNEVSVDTKPDEEDRTSKDGLDYCTL